MQNDKAHFVYVDNIHQLYGHYTDGIQECSCAIWVCS